MSEFEFLRNVNIGQHLPIDAPFQRLDARARLLSLLFLMGAVTLAPHLSGLSGGILALVGVLLWAHIPLSFAFRGLLPPLPFVLILAVLQVFINPYVDGPYLINAGFIHVSAVDLQAGVALVFRFAGLILAISLATASISTSEGTRALWRLLRPFNRLGFPVEDFVMMVQITLRFVPLLAQSAERIAKAQAARGAEWGVPHGNLLQRTRQILPLIVPLTLMSLRRAENIALAMDARAYGAQAVRTSMVAMYFRTRDALAVAGAMIVAVLVVWL